MGSLDRAIAGTRRLVQGFARALERHKILLVGCYSAIFLFFCARLAATKLMWYDEFSTYYPAKLPSMAAVINFFQKGNDVHTPAASLVAWLSMRLLGDGPVVDRLPFTIGYLIFCICIFVFVARRCPAVYAAAAMIFPALTLMFYYATELRPYGLVLGLAGLALISYQSAAEDKRRFLSLVGLFLSLVGAICCHYYAVFLLIPLGLAELARTWQKKRIDAGVWSVLLASPFVLFLFLPAMKAALSIYPKAMQPAHLGQIQSTYLGLLSISNAPILAAILICIVLAPELSIPQEKGCGRIPLSDWVLAATLALLPVFAVPAGLIIGAFNQRYILPMVAGVAIVLAFGLCRFMKGDPFAGTVITLVFLGWFLIKTPPEIRTQMYQNGGIHTQLGQPLQASWARLMQESDLPIAVAGPGLFMQVQYYGSETERARVHYLNDFEAARRYNSAPTNEVNMTRFRQTGLIPVGVVDFREFVARNPHFLACVESMQSHWLIPALLEAKAQLRLRESADPVIVFEVTIP